MPVNQTHPDYDSYRLRWTAARHVLEGEDTIKRQGVLYLPKITGQSNDEYAFYKERARFVNFTSRTLEGLHGMIFRKDPTVTMPAELAVMEPDTDLLANDITTYCKNVTRDVLSVGRGGTLVDWSDEEKRPYFVYFPTEQIINWKQKRVNGRVMLILLVLKEYTDDPPPDNYGSPQSKQSQATATPREADDIFDQKLEEQYRVLKLNLDKAVPYYSVEIWKQIKEGEKKDSWLMTESSIPSRAGQSLPEIPFVFHGSIDSTPNVNRIPLEDIMRINLHHYRIDADLNQGLHYCGCPTPWAAGFEAKTELKIGSSIAWVSENPQAKAGYLEFTGQGLKPLGDELDRDQKMMAVLGARLLEEQKREVEAADTVRIRQGGEASTLIDTSVSLSQSLSKCFRWAYWWQARTDLKFSDMEDTVVVTLNTDFIATSLDAKVLTALVGAYVSGALDLDSFIWNLQQGNLIPPDKTAEEIIAQIKSNPPLLMGGNQPPANGNAN